MSKSLKEIAEETLARIRSGEKTHETKKETEMKQMKREEGSEPNSCFTKGSACFIPMKQGSQRKTAKNDACFTVSFPGGETGVTRLPEHVAAGLKRLEASTPPRGIIPTHWAEVVADALRLASEGWTSKALGLGWTELTLFGAVTDPAGDPAGDGLAVRLAGRRVLAISASFATIADPDGGRTWHYRGSADGAALLWDLHHRKGLGQ